MLLIVFIMLVMLVEFFMKRLVFKSWFRVVWKIVVCLDEIGLLLLIVSFVVIVVKFCFVLLLFCV